jgi:hypothetical protein
MWLKEEVTFMSYLEALRIADQDGSSDISVAAKALANNLESRLTKGLDHELDLASFQALMSVLCRIYADSVELGEVEPPVLSRTGISATDAMAVSAGLLQAAGMSAFELGFWQSWTGR